MGEDRKKTGAGAEPAGAKLPRFSDVSDPKSWIAGPDADELRKAFLECLPMLRRAPTCKDDRRVLDASADVVEMPDGSFRLREP